MIVRTLEETRNTDRAVRAENGNWESVRLSLKDDGMGFSFHITTIFAGTETHIWYQNHFETVYCISGEGEVETLDDGKIWPIKPGTVYILNKHDNHLLRAKTDMQLACAFNPPLHGKEQHDENGVYALEAEAIEG
ncbi:L-ectoine synthase [Alcanivorax sp. S71-1-4]|uniref:L-ectoine synthase n=1 Tax=Isoalcanivorax pacificus W11-5 TaxID=391936 RepID=A0A0B4XQQ5_9GAMM|nr:MULTISPECIES: ectoine synthase [Alcanivoracaceae]AJD49496.1 L-ectoine synthase [Isoalcanivorax pacificus W11-5]KAF0810716.1 L-ectoine synthase [Alcanivorax sp. S71-1-4]